MLNTSSLHHPIPRFSFYAQLQKMRNWGTCKRFDLGWSSQVVVKKGQFWIMIIKGSSFILQNHKNSMGRRQSFATSQIYQSYSFSCFHPWPAVAHSFRGLDVHATTLPNSPQQCCLFGMSSWEGLVSPWTCYCVKTWRFIINPFNHCKIIGH